MRPLGEQVQGVGWGAGQCQMPPEAVTEGGCSRRGFQALSGLMSRCCGLCQLSPALAVVDIPGPWKRLLVGSQTVEVEQFKCKVFNRILETGELTPPRRPLPRRRAPGPRYPAASPLALPVVLHILHLPATVCRYDLFEFYCSSAEPKRTV